MYRSSSASAGSSCQCQSKWSDSRNCRYANRRSSGNWPGARYEGTDDMTEQPLVLVINCGSSSLKFAVHALDRHRPLLSGLADRLGLEGATISFKDQSGKTVHDLKEPTHAVALEAVLEELAARGWLNCPRCCRSPRRAWRRALLFVRPCHAGGVGRDRGHQPARAVTQSTRCTRNARRALAPRGAARGRYGHRLPPDHAALGLSLCCAHVAVSRPLRAPLRLSRDVTAS